MFFSSSQTLHSEKPDTTEPEMLFSLFSLLAEWIVPPRGAPVSGVGTGRVHGTLSEGKVHGGGCRSCGGRDAQVAGKLRSSVPFGLVKICAFSVCCVHRYEVGSEHYNSSLFQSSFIEIHVCNVAYK